MKPYRFIEKLTRADTAFEAAGKTLEELFENSALALFEINADIKTVKPNIKREINLESDSIENLLFNFLDEIIFLKDRDSLVFSECKVKIKENKTFKLEAEILGDKIDYKKQKLRVDAKAVTMHNFSVKKHQNIYKATVVIDI